MNLRGGFGVGVAALVVVVWLATREAALAACGPGFSRSGTRCCPGAFTANGGCIAVLSPEACPPPLTWTNEAPAGCDAPQERVLVPPTAVLVGPSDWEAEGRVAPRTVRTAAFQIDRFEATIGALVRSRSADTGRFRTEIERGDLARAASALTFEEARRYCEARHGRLPTADEWMVAASGSVASRYPWGDTGAVCRRAAYGLFSGPCGRGADGPDTVGAHHDGATSSGIEDLAGNVAEWVAPDRAPGNAVVALGGSWRSGLATELRTWSRLELRGDALGRGARDDRIGARCAFDVRP